MVLEEIVEKEMEVAFSNIDDHETDIWGESIKSKIKAECIWLNAQFTKIRLKGTLFWTLASKNQK